MKARVAVERVWKKQVVVVVVVVDAGVELECRCIGYLPLLSSFYIHT